MQAQTDSAEISQFTSDPVMSSSGDPKTPEKNQDESETNASCISLKREPQPTPCSMESSNSGILFVFKKRKT